MSKQKPTWKFDELRDSGVGEGGLVGDVHKRNLREILIGFEKKDFIDFLFSL